MLAMVGQGLCQVAYMLYRWIVDARGEERVPILRRFLDEVQAVRDVGQGAIDVEDVAILHPISSSFISLNFLPSSSAYTYASKGLIVVAARVSWYFLSTHWSH